MITATNKYRPRQKTKAYKIDKSDDITIRRLLIRRLTPNFRTIEKIMGKPCPLSTTSIGRWETMLKELEKEKAIQIIWDSIPLYIKIKAVA
jgi:hypothetical protein